MVYTDGVHLTADSLDELHAFARNIGLKREWFQTKRYPHYDLMTRRKARQAERAGALPQRPRVIVTKAKILSLEIKKNPKADY